jgi:AraC-like DNA-binding protein
MKFLNARIEKPLPYVSCGHFISDENWIHSERIINNFELIIGIKGTAYIQQNDSKYEVTPGKALLLFPGQVHKGYAFSEDNTSFYWLHFLCNSEYGIIDQNEIIKELFPLNSGKYSKKISNSIIIPDFSSPENIEKIIILFRQLLHTSNGNYYTPLISDYLVTLVLTELTQQTINNLSQILRSYDVANKKLIHIMEWIRINIDKELSVRKLAQHFNFNADYLTRLFKKHTGLSSIQYINNLKIAKAKDCLCQSEKSIKEIAFNLGFKDDKYFLKLFKERENLTPSEYRNAYYKIYLNNK